MVTRCGGRRLRWLHVGRSRQTRCGPGHRRPASRWSSARTGGSGGPTMHTEDIALDRLARALRDRIRPAMTRPVGTLEVAAWDVGGEPVAAATGLRAPYRPFAIGQPWGRPWDTTWFRVRATVPDPPPGDLELVVDLGWRDDSMPGFQAEALAYDAEGTVLKAVQPRNNWVPVRGPAVEVYLEAAANPQFFGGRIEQFRPTPLGDVHTAGSEP